jgi:hypothetical protein
MEAGWFLASLLLRPQVRKPPVVPRGPRTLLVWNDGSTLLVDRARSPFVAPAATGSPLLLRLVSDSEQKPERRWETSAGVPLVRESRRLVSP